MTDSIDEVKQHVVADVETWRGRLISIADSIHAKPELAFREFESAALLSGTLEDNGFTVKRGIAGLDTAFVATLHGQAEGSTVAFLAEYDALPGLGHACGHNLIGTSAVGAGLAMKSVLSGLAGTIQVIGTPGEEMVGGKAIMVDAGMFAGVDAAMMVHPSNRNDVNYRSLTYHSVIVSFSGRTAHAAVQPEAGINALDAVILTFTGVNALRQHLRDDARVHGIITHGGEACNVVPDYAAAEFGIRAADMAYSTQVLNKVRACAEAAAQATGACLEFKQHGPTYDAMVSNPELAALAEANLGALGIGIKPRAASSGGIGSSDMGNVSQVVPALHPYLAIAGEDMGRPHTRDFCKAAISPAGHEALINAAKLMAMTAVDLLSDPANMNAARKAYEAQTAG